MSTSGPAPLCRRISAGAALVATAATGAATLALLIGIAVAILTRLLGLWLALLLILSRQLPSDLLVMVTRPSPVGCRAKAYSTSLIRRRKQTARRAPLRSSIASRRKV